MKTGNKLSPILISFCKIFSIPKLQAYKHYSHDRGGKTMEIQGYKLPDDLYYEEHHYWVKLEPYHAFTPWQDPRHTLNAH